MTLHAKQLTRARGHAAVLYVSSFEVSGSGHESDRYRSAMGHTFRRRLVMRSGVL